MSEVVKITLGDSTFDIPQLPLGVQRKLTPVIRRMAMRAMKAKDVAETMQETMASDENIDDAELCVAIVLAFINPDFTPAKFDGLIIKARDQIFLMNTSFGELIEASMTVALQAGGKRLGEKMAAMKQAAPTPPPANPPITTPSSPSSASTPDGSGTASSGQ